MKNAFQTASRGQRLEVVAPTAPHHEDDDGSAHSSTRRSFFKMAAASGLALGLFPMPDAASAADQTVSALKAYQQPLAFVRIEKSGVVFITINRLEFGQGVHTALPMILAEELDVDWSNVNAEHGNAAAAYFDPSLGVHLTGGSRTIKNSYAQYRELGARARLMLMQAAANQWRTSPDGLRTDRGFVIAPTGQRLGYGELAELAMKLPVPQQVILKNPADFRLIGKPVGRLDARAKSTGVQAYGIDVQLPGMLTAVTAYPPVFGGGIASLDDAAARSVVGVKAVLRFPLHAGGEGIAVVADGYWAAKRGRDALMVKWATDVVDKVDSQALLAAYRKLAAQTGSIAFDADVSGLVTAPRRIDAEFVFPYLAHAPMEPLNCTIQLGGEGKVTRAAVWVGTQMPGMDARAVAKTLGIPGESVEMHVQMAGGGFGRRGITTGDYVVEACNIALAARAAGLNMPIRSLWSREDDIRGGYYRPMHVHRAVIAHDAQGKILAWDHVVVGQSIMTGTPFAGFRVKNGVDTTAIEGMRRPYDLPMRLSVHHPKVNVPVLWWRGVGSTHTAYVMETLIDEIARTTGQDPVAYRFGLMGADSARHRAALQLAVDRSGYGKRQLARGRAWGVAVHESFDTVVAYVVEASMADGTPRLHAVTAGVHCNLMVNPRTVETQIQGAALMGLGMCQPGVAITLKNGVVEQSNFHDYPVPRMTDMPMIAVHVVPSTGAPTGIGEPGLPPLAPAFANALSVLTGKPLRELPFKFA